MRPKTSGGLVSRTKAVMTLTTQTRPSIVQLRHLASATTAEFCPGYQGNEGTVRGERWSSGVRGDRSCGRRGAGELRGHRQSAASKDQRYRDAFLLFIH